mmetsp:Transcript_63371/g.151226  ORF Transcript_63371/g.151226 Transcript_63371/m.151226 type:complete len:790 (-) Transcript_63371:126-2495(-)
MCDHLPPRGKFWAPTAAGSPVARTMASPSTVAAKNGRIFCQMCVKVVKKLPSTWQSHGSEFYCSSCWSSVVCNTCNHHDPQGSIVRGRWMCRQCRHHQLNKHHHSEEAHEALHRAIIEDQNGEPSPTADEGSLPMPDLCEDSAEDSEEEAFAEEGGDTFIPLSGTSTKTGGQHPPSLSQDASRRASKPGQVVLLLDTSASMNTQDVLAGECEEVQRLQFGKSGSLLKVTEEKERLISRLEAATACAMQFVKDHSKLRPQDRFSLVTFNDEANIVVEASSALAFQERLAESCFLASHGTCYEVALRAALDIVKRHQAGDSSSHVVMLSDGRPADTKASLAFFQQSLLHSDAEGGGNRHLHGIGFGTSVLSYIALQQLACLSGGSFALSGSTVRGLAGAFSSVSTTISSLGSALGLSLTEKDHRRVLRQTIFELPEIGSFGKNKTWHFKTTRTAWRYDGERFSEQRFGAGAVVRRKLPYMRGGMRLVYGFQDKTVVADDGSWMVAKASRFHDQCLNTTAIVSAHAKSTAVARHFAARFNEQVRTNLRSKLTKRNSAATIFFVPCFVYEVDSAEVLPEGEAQVFTAERYLPGAFLKYNSNNGYVGEQSMLHHEVVQTFLHFSYAASGGSMMVADLQGVARQDEVLLTDPQVLSLERCFGPGDLGAAGMQACLSSHRCGAACRALGLKPVTASTLRQLGPMASGRRGGHSSGTSGVSQGWEKISEAGSSEWEKLSVPDLPLSEGPRSSHSSTASWTKLACGEASCGRVALKPSHGLRSSASSTSSWVSVSADP